MDDSTKIPPSPDKRIGNRVVGYRLIHGEWRPVRFRPFPVRPPLIKASSETFNDLVRKGYSLVMFDVLKENYGCWESLHRSFRKLGRQYAGRVQAIWIDIYENSEFWEQVKWVPTFRIFHEGVCLTEWDGHINGQRLEAVVSAFFQERLG